MSAATGPTYVVHSPAAALRLGLPLLALPILVGLVVGVLRGHWWVGPVALLAALALSVSSLRTAWTRLAVDQTGIALSFPRSAVLVNGTLPGSDQRFVAWPWVHRVEVDAAREVVRVVVRADAPLPPWEHGRVVDPCDPESGPVVEQHVPGIDVAALHQAVLAASPSTVVRSS